MILLKNSYFHLEKRIFIVVTVVSLLFLSREVFAQEDPPRPVEITPTTQELSFGSFTYAVSTGTVTVSPVGGRSASGAGVVLLNIGTPTAALFNVVANAGTVITITFGADAILHGSSGGTMTLRIDTSDPESPFTTINDYPDPTLLYIGGTLTVGDSTTSLPGTYTGSFDVTLNQD
jgi:hypothetical protein